MTTPEFITKIMELSRASEIRWVPDIPQRQEDHRIAYGTYANGTSLTVFYNPDDKRYDLSVDGEYLTRSHDCEGIQDLFDAAAITGDENQRIYVKLAKFLGVTIPVT